VGWCPAGESVFARQILLPPHEWTKVQAVSKVNRYIALTPRVTKAGYLSPTNHRLGMTPQPGSLEGYWQEMKKNEWLEEVANLRKGESIPAIATSEMWDFPLFQALQMNEKLGN